MYLEGTCSAQGPTTEQKEECVKRILAALLVLLATQPLSAADMFLGTWRMRPTGVAGDRSQQVQTITQVGDGVKVDVEVDIGNGAKMSMTYTTKLDGAEVPVYSSGKVVMMFRAKRTGPNTYEGSSSANGMTTNFKTTVSADGKVMTSESTTGPIKARSVYDRVK